MDIKITKDAANAISVSVNEPCRLDLDGAVEFGTKIKEYVEDNLISTVVMDFSYISFISSFGLKVILEIYKTLQEPPVIKIVNLAPGLKNAFTMVGFDKFIEIE